MSESDSEPSSYERDVRSSGRDLETAALTDALAVFLRRALRRSRKGLSKAADSSRRRLELRQKRKDLDHFWVRLGKTAHRLVEAGEIDHPALRKAMTRIHELETELEAFEASLRAGETSPDVAQPAEEG
jgi:hypothetical protein